MFEKFKDRFSSQKSDDAFIEATINARARQQYIAKLVMGRSQYTVVLALFLFSFVISLVTDALTSLPTSHLQTSGNLAQGLAIAALLVGINCFDYQIKFLRALEAGAIQTVRPRSEV